jgi:hypothetical protein
MGALDYFDPYDDHGDKDGDREMSMADYDNWPDYNDQEAEPDIISFIEIVARTKKAVLFRNKNGSFWLPKSIIDIDEGEKIVSVPVWCDWNYIDDKPPKHPNLANPKGKTCLTKSGKPKRTKSTT